MTYIFKFEVIYFDDIFIYSAYLADPLKQIEHVLKALRVGRL